MTLISNYINLFL